jgi:hypothetical protein
MVPLSFLYALYMLFKIVVSWAARRSWVIPADRLFWYASVSSAVYPASWHREFTGGLELGDRDGGREMGYWSHKGMLRNY